MSENQLKFEIPEINSPEELIKSEIDFIVKNSGKKLLEEEGNSRYPLEKFNRYFAPFFLAIYEAPENVDILSLWINEVGSAIVDVDIFNEKNEIVFTVPAVFNNKQLNIEENAKDNIRFNNLENVRSAEGRNNQRVADVQYFNGVGKKLSKLFYGFKPDPSHAEKWLKIYEYYNLTPPSTDEIKIVPKSQEEVSGAQKQETGWGDLDAISFKPEIT